MPPFSAVILCGGNLSEHFAHSANVLRLNLLERKQNSTDGSERNPYRILPLPEKFGRTVNFGRQALVHGTIERGLLQHFPLRMLLW